MHLFCTVLSVPFNEPSRGQKRYHEMHSLLNNILVGVEVLKQTFWTQFKSSYTMFCLDYKNKCVLSTWVLFILDAYLLYIL